ncbi:MAG: ABC transporter ATP-binding protein [Muribaculaceae bacterium]|nr:ABC transporter ATP-binding protein [Muribaculaceae bacterium]
MKEFFQLIRRFVPPYKKALAGNISLNILAQLLNVFSFSLLIPILQILFNVDSHTYQLMSWSDGNVADVIKNNFYYYMNTLILDKGELWVLMISGLILMVMTLFKTSCYFASAACLIPLRSGIIRDVRVLLYHKIIDLPLSFFSENRKGDIIARTTSDVGGFENALTNSMEMLLKNPISIFITLGVLLFINWKLTIFILLVIPLLIWVMGSISRQLKKGSKDVQTRWGIVLSQLEETLSGLRIIKAFLAEKKMAGRFTNTINTYRKALNRMQTRQASAHPVSEFMGTCIIVIVLWAGGYLILQNDSGLDASSFIFYLVMLYNIINPIKDLSKAYYNIPIGMGCWERINKILGAENPIKEKENPVHCNSLQRDITYKNVSFSYSNSEREVLKNINLTIKKGQTIALVGQSGSGKSTMVDLLPRFHDIEKGSISIDGVDIRDLSIHDLRALIGNVNQEAILFNDTFFNNITFGVESATMEQVIEAAKIANAHEFIINSENGYDTYIGDRGCLLSGGQRQRISIARAILKNPPILILDEATSALDTESERLVQEALEHLMKSRTTIAIAHRLSTIKNADEICVLYEGEIVERGTHEELINTNGYYKKLNDMQSL